MNPIDDLFRDGLGGRKGVLPQDMWQRIQAGKPAAAPEGAELDALFSDKLKDRRAALPAGMWARIMAARKPASPVITRTRVATLLALLLIAAAFLFWPGESQETPAIDPAAPTAPAAREAIANQDTEAQPESAVVSAESPETTSGEGASSTVSAAVTASASGAATDDLNTFEGEVPVASIPVETDETEGISGLLTNASITEATTGTAPEKLTETTSAIVEDYTVDRSVQAASPSLELAELMLLDNPTELPKLKRSQRPRPRAGGAFRASPSGVQMELLFGVAYANQMFSIRDESNRSLLDAREVSEFPETSYQVTARATWQLKERIYLLGGLTYAEVRNQLEYDQFVNGVQTLVKTNNSIRLLEAPLLVGFSIPGRRMRVSLNVGPVVNLTTSARGRFISPDAPGLQDLSVDANYRSNVGIGWMSSITTAYQIGKERPFTLLVEPFFKYYPGAFTAPSAALQEKYWVAGLQLGVRKSLR